MHAHYLTSIKGAKKKACFRLNLANTLTDFAINDEQQEEEKGLFKLLILNVVAFPAS